MASTSRRGALREYLGGALWAMPTVAVVVSLLVGAGLSRIEIDPDSWLGQLLFRGDAGAARELLIVVSATMITVTGLVFTLTVVALQISSSQFTPRLLRSFLRDRGTQVVLSIFVSTFAYATAGLYTVGRVDDGEPYVPRIAVSGSLLLALGSVAAFVWYLHHLAHSIQIDYVMRGIERATLRVIEHADRSGASTASSEHSLVDPPTTATAVPSPTSGYIQAAFPDAVIGPASRRGLCVRYRCAVGDHVVAGSAIADVWDTHDADHTVDAVDADTAADIVDAGLRIGFERTFEQDAAFGIRQLADISLRAMSPAINDPYTAVQSIQHITVAMCAALDVYTGPQVWRDEAGRARVLLPMPALADHLDLACGQLRRVAAHEPKVVVALLGLLDEVRQRVVSEAELDAVRKEADLLLTDARRSTAQPADLDIVEAAAARILSPPATHVSPPVRPC